MHLQGTLILILVYSTFIVEAVAETHVSLLDPLKTWDYYLAAGLGWGQHARFEPSNSSSSTETRYLATTVRTMEEFSGDANNDDKSWRVAGGAWVHPHYGIEFGYVDLGKTTLNQMYRGTRQISLDLTSPFVFLGSPPGDFSSQGSVVSDLEVSGISLLAKARHPLTKSFDLNVSLGAIRWDINERRNSTRSDTVSGPISIFFPSNTTENESLSLESHGIDLAFGVGGRLRVNRRVHLAFEWTRYEADEFDSHVDFVGVGAEIHFSLEERDDSVLQRYTRESIPLLDSLKQLKPFNRGAVWFENWELFFGLSGGLAEHNSLGDSGDEDVLVETTGLTTTTEIFTIDEDALAWRVFLGAFVSRYFGVEFGYIDFGRAESRFSTTSVTTFPALTSGGLVLLPMQVQRAETSIRTHTEISAYTIKALARYPFLGRFEFAANLGATIWDENSKTILETPVNSFGIPQPGGGVASSLVIDNGGSGVDATYGVALRARFWRDVWGGVEYARYEVGRDDADADYLGIGLQYRFGE